MNINKNIDFIFEDEKIIKPKKYIFKRLLILLIIGFFLINSLIYIGFYNNYVSKAPEQLKEGRKDLIIAHIFSMYEVIAVQLGISFTNPILKPLQMPKEYFYNKGIKKLPKNDADKVYWYQMLIYYPIVYELNTSGYEVGNVTHNYGIAFTENLLNDIYINLEILSKYELSDYKNNEYIQKKLLWLTSEMFDIYVYNYHRLDYTTFNGWKAIDEARNDEKIKELVFVYQFIKDIFNKSYYQEDFNKYILSKVEYKLDYYQTFFDATTLLLYNRISHQRFNCNNDFDKKLMENFLNFEFLIRQLMKNHEFKQSKINHLNVLLNKTVFIQQEKIKIQACMQQQKGE